MSLLAALVRAYDSRPDMPALNYSMETVSFLIPLKSDGAPPPVPVDLRAYRKSSGRVTNVSVPKPVKRTSAVVPNFLWDKTSYSLGISARPHERTAAEHAKFVQWHLELLSGNKDAGLIAFADFLRRWRPDMFRVLGWPEEMTDKNLVFGLEGKWDADEGGISCIHQRPAARELWASINKSRESGSGACLVTGRPGAVARLHPTIKGVLGAQPSGASLISFNLDAFCSYEHLQGDNSPISEASAFKYGAMLNRYLEFGSRNKLQVGELSLVFWADGPEADAANIENLFASLIEPDVSGIVPFDLPEAKTRLGKAARADFHVLGISPNSARLIVRFHVQDSFENILVHLLEHQNLMRIQNAAGLEELSLGRTLSGTAMFAKAEHLSCSLVANFVTRVLAGEPYPHQVLQAVIMRLRSDKKTTLSRVALLKAILIRNYGIPLAPALDPENNETHYLLGRLLATFDFVEQEARGGGLGTPVSAVHYAVASSNPARCFPTLALKATQNIDKIRARKPALSVICHRLIDDLLPKAALKMVRMSTQDLCQQALFAVGCYHQRQEFYRSPKNAPHASAIE